MNDNPSPVPPVQAVPPPTEAMFEKAADLFRIMSAPIRLRIISSLCQGEKNVGELLQEITATQPNMSQHLNTLYKGGVLSRRREGVQIFYSIANQDIAAICKAVCTGVKQN
ncbi:MAG: helix-turn-helix transcriptional regulator [Comamonas sp.]|nr:helix-turn-helix transcriptional regulator [Comamonas sp.]